MAVCLVEREGSSSNTKLDSITDNSGIEIEQNIEEFEKILDTMRGWNEILEKDVPYYRDQLKNKKSQSKAHSPKLGGPKL